MAPLRGWCRRGLRLKDHAPHGHWKTQTFLAALRHDQVTAPCLLDRPVNAQSFLTYVMQFLLATLKPGDIVVTATNFVRAEIILAPTKAKPCAKPFDRSEHFASFCPPTLPPSSESFTRALIQALRTI
jgi:transposase